MNQMPDCGLFSISDFAKFSRLTRDTLLHYDRIGLLSPASRGENNYRYYTGSQLPVVNVIRTLQQLGMTLEEIKDLKDRRTPELSEEVLEQQIERIEIKIQEWVCARKLLNTILKTIRSVTNVNEDEITIKFLPAEAIVLGELNDYSRGRTFLDALLSFYNTMSERYSEPDLNYYVWSIFSEERLRQGDFINADRFYFYNPEGHDRRPAALYAIGYARVGYFQGGALYRKMAEYIDSSGFEICGPAYVEFPLNEVVVAEENDYLMRLMIPVREKA